MIGKIFGRLTVLERNGSTKDNNRLWLCQCDCGRTTSVRATHLRQARIKSCGCLKADLLRQLRTTHGETETRLYRTWTNIKTRCSNPKVKEWPRYGGRGITICDRWNDSFESFKIDMGDIPFSGAQIDRINNNGNYEPGNCRWVSTKVNCRNKRTNHLIIFNDLSLCVPEWAERTGINQRTIHSRLDSGWTVEKTLTTPSRGIANYSQTRSR